MDAFFRYAAIRAVAIANSKGLELERDHGDSSVIPVDLRNCLKKRADAVRAFVGSTEAIHTDLSGTEVDENTLVSLKSHIYSMMLLYEKFSELVPLCNDGLKKFHLMRREKIKELGHSRDATCKNPDDKEVREKLARILCALANWVTCRKHIVKTSNPNRKTKYVTILKSHKVQGLQMVQFATVDVQCVAHIGGRAVNLRSDPIEEWIPEKYKRDY